MQLFWSTPQAPHHAALGLDRYEDTLAGAMAMEARWYYECRSPQA